ncbi:hypothetical protein [Paracoccus aminovorans]|uniref:hypothetical protein n=1 Tax=Paracoccus aminovorans TaxID=34004 RepID=UPI000942E281|nr:hypothetical protein [Paracoccus aminovorans]
MMEFEASEHGHDLELQLGQMIEIARALPHQIIPSKQIEVWAGGLKYHQFFNLIGLMIAERYAANMLSYQICDSIMNYLWRAWLDGVEDGGHVPQPFYEIYEAFDAGEYPRTPDGSDDPVKDHTDPWIADILSRPAHPML